MSSTATFPVRTLGTTSLRVQPVGRPRPAGELRLTRRGRLAVLVLGLVVMFAVGLLLSTTSVASDSSEGYPTRVVMVGPGDTLWDIADDVAGTGSTRDMVATISSLNDLADGGLQAGQRLVVPLR